MLFAYLDDSRQQCRLEREFAAEVSADQSTYLYPSRNVENS
jgi:hypothetical protein